MAIDHIFLSPHLDDAVLSCGGSMQALVVQGEGVLVLNIFAGIPDYRRLSPFALELHHAWGDPADPVGARRAEDEAALRLLGVEGQTWNLVDGIYRFAGEEFLYPSREALFGPVDPRDTDVLFRLAAAFAGLHRSYPETTFYAPLAAGHHVDHQITRAAAIALSRLGAEVIFYEDFPYVTEAAALEEVRAELGAVGVESITVPIDVEAKIAAIAQYKSQIGVLFETPEQMAEKVRSYAAMVAGSTSEFAERYWVSLKCDRLFDLKQSQDHFS